jgi:predicted MFS family arabinose efflux permease
LMPFGTAFIVNNVGLSFAVLPVIYLITGLCAVFVGPLVGRASDRFGKFPTFCFGTGISVIMVIIWTNIGHLALAWVIVINVLLFAGIFSRMIPSQALVSAIPGPTQRGAFNAVSASLQQMAGGFSSGLAGLIIVQMPDGRLEHFDWLGYIVVAVALVSLALMYLVHKQVPEPAPR